MPFPDIKHLGRVWLASGRASVVREMEFRANFLLGLVRQGLWLGVFIIFINVIFRHVDDLSGWSRAEMLVILALSRLMEGLINVLFVHNLMELPQAVQKGQFDFYLTKPVPAQFMAAFRSFSLYSIGNVIAGAVLLAYALPHLPTLPHPAAWFIFPLLAACGLVVFYSWLVIVATLVFYLERLEALWGFLVLFSEPLTVPFDIFPRPARVALTYLLPIALVVFVPAQALTGRLQWWQVPLAAVLAALFLLIANLAWRAGLRRYSSASS